MARVLDNENIERTFDGRESSCSPRQLHTAPANKSLRNACQFELWKTRTRELKRTQTTCFPVDMKLKAAFNTLLMIIIGIGILVPWSLWAAFSLNIANWFAGADSIDKAAQWGDSFGGANALISGLGLAAVILTLRSQTKSLEIQQNALKQQQEDIHKQRFESTFFELLRLLRDCRSEVLYGAKDSTGLTAFAFAANRIRQTLEENNKSSDDKKCLIRFYETDVHHFCEASISPYFRIIYRMLHKLKSDTLLTQDEKLSYAKLLRGQLNSDELILIGFNGKLELAKDFSNLICDFRLLKYLPDEPISAELRKHYPPETFQGHP